jgi:hypothetical protein
MNSTQLAMAFGLRSFGGWRGENVELISVIVGLLVGGVVLYIARRKWTNDTLAVRRAFGLDDRLEPDPPLYFAGEGADTTSPTYLKSGDYKCLYTFPEGVLVKVDLLRVADGERETLVLASGAGAAGFMLERGGRHLFDIQPAHEDAEWEIEITRLGLPSGHKPPLQ